MKNMMNRVAVVLAALVSAATSSSLAQDLAPSWRGQPGSGRQEWHFDSSSNPANPEVTAGVTAGARASILSGQFAMGWQQRVIGMGTDRTGLWDLGRNGVMTLSLNNPTGVYQRISVQVSQWLDGSIYSELATVTVPGAIPEGGDTGLTSTATVGGWFVDETEWLVPAGGTIDRVIVTSAFNGSVIDRVGVDTLSPVATTPVALNIQRVSGGINRVRISWESATAYDLQWSTNLADSLSWQPVPESVEANGNLHSIAIEAGDALRFYRLKQP
jgi:hypothetical protein